MSWATPWQGERWALPIKKPRRLLGLGLPSSGRVRSLCLCPPSPHSPRFYSIADPVLGAGGSAMLKLMSPVLEGFVACSGRLGPG